MTNFPEDDQREPAGPPAGGSLSIDVTEASPSPEQQPAAFSPLELNPATPAEAEPVFMLHEPRSAEPTLFQSWAQPQVRPPARIPHFGHLCLLLLLGGIGFACTVAVLFLAMRFHLFGWELPAKSSTDIHLVLASEALLYLIAFAFSLVVFPLFWDEGFFAGIQWRGAVARKRFWPLAATALGCAGLAALDEVLMPGPSNAPIEKMMRSSEAAWLMFGFGVTIAPFFEEVFFRGFLLPALCTAWDWAAERIAHKPAPPLDANAHPQWSISAMIVASVLTSIPFALIHVEQQGHSLGPFLLLIVVSLVLCTVRLKTRSLACSTLVHACYNFLIFSLAMIGTGGFRHFDKM